MATESYTYSLTGKVLPERAVVNLPLTVKVMASPEGNMPAGWEVVVSAVRSQVAVMLTTPQRVDDLDDMRDRVEAVTRFCVDALGFLLACGYDVELTQVIDLENFSHQVFGVDVPSITETPEYSANEIAERFQQILSVSARKQPPLRRSLVDFREAIRSYEDTPFFCFRAIEDLRQYFVVGDDDDVKRTWNEMSDNLAVPEDTVEYVWKVLRPLATSRRHGGGAKIDRTARTKMLRTTWDLISRFVAMDASA